MTRNILMLHEISDHIKNLLDAIAAGVSLAVLAQLLPYISAGLSAVWLVIRLYDRIKYGPNIKDE